MHWFSLFLGGGTSCSFFKDDDDDDDESIEKKTSDYLFLMYFDADNNLNDSLWYDIYSEQYALRTLESSSLSVRILALWDGASEEDCDAEDLTRKHPNGALYELGAMDDTTNAKIRSGDKSFLMSANTTDLTSSVSWLATEPDMSDESTLEAFLTWANKYYSATNVVLMLSDHGAGTEYETLSGGMVTATRSLCADETNGSNKLLTATDVAEAIEESGISLNVIWMDCCLQGNAETAYLLRGKADYLVTSANLSYSNDHYTIFKGLSTSPTPLTFAKSVVSAYKNYLSKYSMGYDEDTRASFDTYLTQAVYNLSSTKQKELYSAVDALASSLVTDGETVCDAVYAAYLVQTPSDVDTCKGMAFAGTYVYLNDIAYFCKNLVNDSSCGVSSTTKSKARAVLKVLDSIIECSWCGRMQYNYYGAYPMCYYAKDVPDFSGSSVISGTYGLTITTQYSFDVPSGAQLKYLPLYTKYEDVTGYSSNWGKLMYLWHN